MKKIDLDNWDRKQIYSHFSQTKRPFYMVTFDLDVTDLYSYVKAKGLPFYYACIYCLTKAMNSVENFRYRITDGEVYLLDKRIPSFTDMKKGSGLFHIITLDEGDDIGAFCAEAARMNNEQEDFIDYEKESDDLIYISSLPWLDMTALTNEGIEDPDDTIPRVTWGRIKTSGDRKTIGISFEVTHRFIDGIHLARFAESFAAVTSALK